MRVRGLDQGQRPALLISECQRGVIEAGCSPFPGLVEQVEARGIVGKTALLADAFRAAGLPVFHLHVVHRPGYRDLPITSVIMRLSSKNGRMLAGSADVEAVPALPVRDGDILHARAFSLVAFHGTELDQTLRNMGVQTLVLAGVSSNVAVNGLAVCASDLGYQVVVAEDCVAGVSAETHAFMLREALPLYSTLASGAEVAQALAAPGVNW